MQEIEFHRAPGGAPGRGAGRIEEGGCGAWGGSGWGSAIGVRWWGVGGMVDEWARTMGLSHGEGRRIAEGGEECGSGGHRRPRQARPGICRPTRNCIDQQT